MKLYEVCMIHKMRSVVEVAANSAEEAKSKAYAKSFEDTYSWEENDTEYVSIHEGSELTEEEAEDY